MKIVGIVQARMGSTRLPGKILKEVNGKPLLAYQIERMKRSQYIDEIVIATVPSNNEGIVNLCKKMDVSYFIGSELDVLERYYQAAMEYNADIIVRMTSDCPLIDPLVIDSVIEMYINNDYDYVSNTQLRTFPRGMDTEVFSMFALKTAYNDAKMVYEREHVTPYLYLNPNIFKIGQYTQIDKNDNHLRLTVDTQEDFELISIILKRLYPCNPLFNMDEIVKIIHEEPKLLEINRHIKQKKLGE